MIPIAHPFVPEEAIEAVTAVLRSKWIGQGPLVDEFERRFAAKFGIDPEYCVAVSSGTAALELAYDLLELGPSDEVVTTPLTCTATNIPLVRRGVRLRFADIRRDTLTIESQETPQARAVINVHLHGVESKGCRWPPEIITDSCQALGLFGGRFTACSFQAIKHITTGDGGMLVCEFAADAREAKLRRWFGIDRRRKLDNDWQPYKDRAILFDIAYPGYKFQMTDIAAALGIAGLERYDEIMEHRAAIWRIYKSAGLPLVDGPRNMYGYACLLVENRDEFTRLMREAGIETNVMQVRNDLYSIFKPFRRELPNMDWVHERHICIPMHNRLTLQEAECVADAAARYAVRADSLCMT